MKKILAAVLLFFSFLLVSCDTKPDNHFTIATWAAGTELIEFTDIIREVNEEADGKYVVKTLSIPSDYYLKLATQIASRKGPELFWLTQELVAKYAQMGTVVDLTDYLNASENLSVDDFYEGVIASTEWDGRYWGIPWIANPFMVYYNKTMFDALDITAPGPTSDWTWEEFIDIGEQLSASEYRGKEIYGTIIEGHPNIETFIWSGGGDIIANDGETVLLDSEGSIRGIGNLAKMLRNGVTPKFSKISYSRNVWFERQEVGMYIGGIQDDFERKVQLMAEEDKFEIGYAPMPVAADGNSYAFDWTASTMISSRVKNKDLAYEVLEALTLKFFNWKIAPPVKGRVDDIVSIYPSKALAAETMQYVLNTARSANYVPEWGEINDRFLWKGIYLPLLQNHNLDYESVTKDMAARMRQYLAKEREK
ncbi:MAG: sugar ABC transporter substrate-binding protein [Acholeplasmataceae bacterium]|nr:sugar ABC transporter substrate-binding protein [Acholeplasmataceae bacterium]